MDLTARELSQGIQAGEFSASEAAEASLERINERDKELNSFIEVTPEIAKESAERVDSKKAAGQELFPLAGVPLGIKDNMHLKGTHLTCGSKMLDNYESVFTASCVQNMLDADLVPMGKLNMDEFAFGSSTETSYFGPAKNPFDHERVPGGSSGGSAAAVAGGLVPVALGSDTGGSIRQPAALCGVVGMKPSYGLVSRYGVVAFASSLDQVGPLTTTVSDAAYVMNALSGFDKRDSTSQHLNLDYTSKLNSSIAGKKVGVVRKMIDAPGVSPEISATVIKAAENLESQGAELVDIALPHAENAMAAYYVIGPAEAFSNLSRFDAVRYGFFNPDSKTLEERSSQARAEGFGAETIRRIMLGSYLLASGNYDEYYVPAQKVRTLITQDYKAAFNQVDMLLMPSTPRPAFKFGEITDPTEMYLSDMFTVSVNIAGNCGISVPVGLGEDSGLPLGVQLVGPQFGDVELLQFASVLEQSYERITPIGRVSVSEGGN